MLTILKKLFSVFQGADQDLGNSTEVGGAIGGVGGSGPVGRQAKQMAKDPRRYKRAALQVEGAGAAQEIASASAQYRGESFAVVDLSHTGIALLRSASNESVAFDPQTNDRTTTDKVVEAEPMTITLGMFEPRTVQVQAVRSSDRVLAFELVNVPTDARLFIDRFLDPKMIGLNMRAVDRSYFSSGETFSTWYCGPRDTNFFLWTNGAKLERALLQLGDDQYGLDRASGVSCLSRANVDPKHGEPGSAPARGVVLFALDIALQIRDGGDAVTGLVKALTEAAESATTA